MGTDNVNVKPASVFDTPRERIPMVAPGDPVRARSQNTIISAVNAMPGVRDIGQVPGRQSPFPVISVRIVRALLIDTDPETDEQTRLFNLHGPCLACYAQRRRAAGLAVDEFQDSGKLIAVYPPEGVPLERFTTPGGQIYGNRPTEPTWRAVRTAGVYRLELGGITELVEPPDLADCSMIRPFIDPVSGHVAWCSNASPGATCDLLLTLDAHCSGYDGFNNILNCIQNTTWQLSYESSQTEPLVCRYLSGQGCFFLGPPYVAILRLIGVEGGTNLEFEVRNDFGTQPATWAKTTQPFFLPIQVPLPDSIWPIEMPLEFIQTPAVQLGTVILEKTNP